MKKIICLLVFIFCSQFIKSQNWQTLGTGVDDDVQYMYADSIGNALYVSGNFTIAGGIPVKQSAKWNGTVWDSIPNSYNQTIFPIGRYNGELYAGDEDLLTFIPTLKKWDGASWVNVANFNSGGVGFRVLVNGTDLYVYGTFDSINGIAASKIAKWNGSTWSAIDTTNWQAGTDIESAVFYNGDLYIAGSIANWDNSIFSIAKWDGTSWSAVGGGVHGPLAGVDILTVFNNKLYAAGLFTTAYGNADNNIEQWDGASWSSVGGGTTNGGGNAQIEGMCVYHNKLYVAGVFQWAGGIPAIYHACWDGTNWCSSGSVPGNNMMAFAVYNDELYAGINSDDTVNLHYIAKYIGTGFNDSCTSYVTGTDQININNESLNIYPNPTANDLTLEFEDQTINDALIEIKNVLGQTIYSGKIKNVIGKQVENINVSDFSNGIYFVNIQLKNDRISAKIIKN